MRKILLLLPVLLMTGCGDYKQVVATEGNSNIYYFQDSINFDIYIDEKTCVEYILFGDNLQSGLSVRLNTDGTPMLNEECLERGYRE